MKYIRILLYVMVLTLLFSQVFYGDNPARAALHQPMETSVSPPEMPGTNPLLDQPQSTTSEQKPTSPQEPLIPGDFTLKASSPVPLTCVTSDPTTGLIYGQHNTGDSFFVYDPVADEWTELAPSFIASTNNGGAAYLDGKIYTVYIGNDSTMGVYDIASNSWSVIPNGLGNETGVIASDGMYLYLAVNDIFIRFQPDPYSWTGLNTPSINIQPWGGMAYWNGRFYAHRGNSYTEFARYDIVSDEWTTLPSLPDGAVLGSAIDPIGHRYYAYGNYGGTNMYSFDLDNEVWSTTTTPFAVDDGGMAYVPQEDVIGIYLVQGEDGPGFARLETPLSQVGNFTYMRSSPVPLTSVAADPTTGLIYAQQNGGTAFYVYDPLPETWKTLQSAPINSGLGGGAAYLEGKIYTIYVVNMNTMGVYDIATDSWSTMPNGLGYGTGVIASDGTYLYMAYSGGISLYEQQEGPGGIARLEETFAEAFASAYSRMNNVYDDIFKRYDPASDTWSDLATPPFGFESFGGMAYWNGRLYAHRGEGYNEFVMYDITLDEWTTLPSLPNGAGRSSAIDPVWHRYYAYGGPLGINWYIFDLDAESWSVETIPYFKTYGGGMAYSVRGHTSGVYFVAGWLGTGFARYQDATPPSGGFTINADAQYVNTTDVTLDMHAEDTDTGVSHMRFRNESPWKALIFQDAFPWGSNALQDALEGNRLPYDQLTSAEMATTELTTYSHVVIPGAQGSTYFDSFNTNLTRFEDYINNGGLMQMSFCALDPDPDISIPFGGTNNFDLRTNNYIVDPVHPLFDGVPNPYKGVPASLNSLTDLLPGDEVLVTTGQTPGGDAVMIERSAGDGKLLAGGQTLERAWKLSEQGAMILENAIPYLAGQMPWSASAAWSLPPGDGVKTVYAQFRNGGSLWSEVYSDTITLDTQPPTAAAICIPTTNDLSFDVNWSGNDTLSGVATYDIQYRVGSDGTWSDWPGLIGTTQTSAIFGLTSPLTVVSGQTYYFRARAHDNASNVSTYTTGGDCSTTVGTLHIYLPMIMGD